MKITSVEDVKKGTIFKLSGGKHLLICTDSNPSGLVKYIITNDSSTNTVERMIFVNRFDVVQLPNEESIRWADEVLERVG